MHEKCKDCPHIPKIKNPCPDCGSGLVLLSSQNLKICTCGYKEPYRLKKGQKSVLIKGLVGGKA